MKQLLQKPFFALGLFWVLAIIIYLPAYHAGYVTDYTGLVPRLEEQGASGILSTYGFPALQPILGAVFYLLFSLDGATGPFWYLAATSLHGINTFLLFRFMDRLLTKHANLNQIAWIASILFLISPFQTEVVVWRVCLNYLLCTAAILGGLHFSLSYLQKGQQRHFLLACLSSFAGLLCFEQALIAPFLSICLGFSLYKSIDKKLIKLSLSQFGLVLLYFLLLKLSINQWIGHYGPETHFSLPFQDMLAAPGQHASKLALLTRYWPHTYKAGFHQQLSQWYISIPLVLMAIAWVVIQLRQAKRPQTTAFFLLAFAAALIPVLNLYFNFILWVENDRYSYIASLFFFPFLVLIFARLPYRFFLIASGLMVLLNGFFLYKTLRAWQDGAKVYWALIDSYPEEESPPTLLLNLPDNLQGAPLFRAFKGPAVAFKSALIAFKDHNYDKEVLEVMQYNMTDLDDGVKVDVNRPDSLSIEFQQWGNWWWRAGKGAGSYQTDQYRIREQGHRYRLILKDSSQQYRVLYQQGTSWKEIDGYLRMPQ